MYRVDSHTLNVRNIRDFHYDVCNQKKTKENKKILPVWPRLVLYSSSNAANIIPEQLF